MKLKWEKLFQFTSVKPVSNLVMPVGNSSALSTVSNLMDKCHLTRPLEVVMMPSTHSSVKRALVNMSQDVYSLILNQLLLTKSELVLTDNSSTQNNWSLVKKMLLTTSLEDITPLVKKLSISVLIESENLLTNVLVSKVSLYSTPLVVALDLDLDPSSSKDFLLITVRNPNSVSLSTHPHKSLLLLSNHTTPYFQPTLFLNILMLLSCLITKLSMISVEELLILKDLPTPTWTDLLLKLFPHLLPL